MIVLLVMLHGELLLSRLPSVSVYSSLVRLCGYCVCVHAAALSVIYTNVLGLPMTVALGMYMGEVTALRSFVFNDVAILNLTLSSIVGVGISWAGFKSRDLLSATSYTVVGVLNKMLTIAVNAVMWDQHATPAGLICLLICIAGGLMYEQAPKRGTKLPSPVTSPSASPVVAVSECPLWC